MANESESIILTCSARDYVESLGKTLSMYEMRGVISYQGGLDGFIKKIPGNAEVVTDFRPCQYMVENGVNYYFAGTALISRKR